MCDDPAKIYRLLTVYTKKYGIKGSTLASAAARGVLVARQRGGKKYGRWETTDQDFENWTSKYRPWIHERIFAERTRLEKQARLADEQQETEVEQTALPTPHTSTRPPTASAEQEETNSEQCPLASILPGSHQNEYDIDVEPVGATPLGSDEMRALGHEDIVDVSPEVDEAIRFSGDRGVDGFDSSAHQEDPEEDVDDGAQGAESDTGPNDLDEDESPNDLPPEPPKVICTFPDGTSFEGIMYKGIAYVELNAYCEINGFKNPWDLAARLRRDGYEVLAFASLVSTEGSETFRRKNYIPLTTATYAALSSRKPQARQTTTWMFQTVLGSLLTNGRYTMPGVEEMPSADDLRFRLQRTETLALANRHQNAILRKRQTELDHQLAVAEEERVRHEIQIQQQGAMIGHALTEIDRMGEAYVELVCTVDATRKDLEETTKDLAGKTGDLKEKVESLDEQMKRHNKENYIGRVKRRIYGTCADSTVWKKQVNTIVDMFAVTLLHADEKWKSRNFRLRDLEPDLDDPEINRKYRSFHQLIRNQERSFYSGVRNAIYKQFKKETGFDLFRRRANEQRRTGLKTPPVMLDQVRPKERGPFVWTMINYLDAAGFRARKYLTHPLVLAFRASQLLAKGTPVEEVMVQYPMPELRSQLDVPVEDEDDFDMKKAVESARVPM